MATTVALAGALLGLLGAAAALGGCGASMRFHRQPHQAVTVVNAGITQDICRVRVRPTSGGNWDDLATIDPIAPGRSRTLRIKHGRWRFRFEGCEGAQVFDSPEVDVSFTHVVFMLCDGACRGDAPPGALVIRHDAEQNQWGVSAPVYVPTGRHRSRLVL